MKAWAYMGVIVAVILAYGVYDEIETWRNNRCVRKAMRRGS